MSLMFLMYLIKRVFNQDSTKTAESLRRLAGCVTGLEVRVSRGEELTWSATSSAWLIRFPCPIAAAAPKALEGGRSRSRLLGVESPAAAAEEEDAPLLLPPPPPPPTHNPLRRHSAAPPVGARVKACHVYGKGPPFEVVNTPL